MSQRENIKVVVRVRPMIEKELRKGYKNIVRVNLRNNSVSLANPHKLRGKYSHTFTFDQVFDANADQAHIYNCIGKPVVDKVLEGYNGSIFAYGQTGAGKTYTMEGEREDSELQGITPRAFDQIFGEIDRRKREIISGHSDFRSYRIKASFVEIYNETIRDLLDPQNESLQVMEHKCGVFIDNLNEKVVHSCKDLHRLFSSGSRERSVSVTNINEKSSRSHAIFAINVEMMGANNNVVRTGKLQLVDLAGSERQSKSKSSGITFKEAININSSLSALGNVIASLVDDKISHVPYRNSKLTRLLKNTLGGNSVTVMIVNIGPSTFTRDETLCTLRFANRAKNITNKVEINDNTTVAELKKARATIRELKNQLGNLRMHIVSIPRELKTQLEEIDAYFVSVATQWQHSSQSENNIQGVNKEENCHDELSGYSEFGSPRASSSLFEQVSDENDVLNETYDVNQKTGNLETDVRPCSRSFKGNMVISKTAVQKLPEKPNKFDPEQSGIDAKSKLVCDIGIEEERIYLNELKGNQEADIANNREPKKMHSGKERKEVELIRKLSIMRRHKTYEVVRGFIPRKYQIDIVNKKYRNIEKIKGMEGIEYPVSQRLLPKRDRVAQKLETLPNNQRLETNDLLNGYYANNISHLSKQFNSYKTYKDEIRNLTHTLNIARLHLPDIKCKDSRAKIVTGHISRSNLPHFPGTKHNDSSNILQSVTERLVSKCTPSNDSRFLGNIKTSSLVNIYN